MSDTDVVARLAEALAKASPAIYGSWPHGATDQPNDLGVDLAAALLPVVREIAAEALEAVAATLESAPRTLSPRYVRTFILGYAESLRGVRQ